MRRSKLRVGALTIKVLVCRLGFVHRPITHMASSVASVVKLLGVCQFLLVVLAVLC